MSMSHYVEKFDKEVIRKEISIEKEVTREALKNPESAIYFPNFPGGRLIINLWATRERLGRAMNVCRSGIVDLIAESIDDPTAPVEIESPPVLENRSTDFDLRRLPIPRYYPEDGGRYITSGVVFAEYGGVRNLSIHRLMILDDKRLAIRLVPRDLDRMYERCKETGEELKIGIAIGVCPPILLASATSVDYDMDELKIANSLREKGIGESVEIANLKNGLAVPAYSEYLLEGTITLETTDEGPFVDITGTYDKVREQPVVRIDSIYHVDDPVFHALLPGGYEHFLLMGLPRESVIKKEVSKIAEVKDVRLSEGGCSWLHGIISIDKKDEDEPDKVIGRAFEAHTSMKRITVVDEDIDIYDDRDVEWALATRFQPDKDLTIVENQRGSSLDPSAPGQTSKWGLDATRPWKGDEFQKASVE